MIGGGRLKIIIGLPDYNYETFVSACRSAGVEPFALPTYWHRLGMWLDAKARYGDKDPEKSFRKIVKDLNEYDNVIQRDTGCCGNEKKEEREDKPIPSLPKRALNYAKNQAQWVAAGKPVVDEETYLRRLSICGVNEEKKCELLNKNDVCTHISCGCPMKKKAKQDMQGLCALNKW